MTFVMAGGKKKKKLSNNPKKSKPRKIKDDTKKILSNITKKATFDEVMTQAESAMDMFDLESALTLFTYAKELLTSQTLASTSVDDSSIDEDNGPVHGNNDRMTNRTLSSILGKMGEIHATRGDTDEARRHFLDAIKLLDPVPAVIKDEIQVNIIDVVQDYEKRAGLYLYLGQLSSGDEALNYFRVGVSELERAVSTLESNLDSTNDTLDAVCGEDNKIDSTSHQEYLMDTRRQLCAAYCSIAELYLTDLCEEPDAETLCEVALNSALSLDEACSATVFSQNGCGEGRISFPQPDALQTIANFRLSQCRVSEAAAFILEAYERMKVGCEAMSALVGFAAYSEENVKDNEDLEAKSRELVDVEAASSLPDYSFRCQTAKIMLECASLLENDDDDTKNKCAESAIHLLGSLLAEDDEIVEVWYLLGCAFMACTPPNDESARYYWENALTMLVKVKEDLEKSLEELYDSNDVCQLEAIVCQINEVKSKLEGGVNEDDATDAQDTEMIY